MPDYDASLFDPPAPVARVELRNPDTGNGTPSAVAAITFPRVVSVAIDDDTLSVDLEDGRTISVPIGWYPRLGRATPAERTNFQISGAGCGIHWPELDEDIGVEGLLLGKKSTESPASFEYWLQRRQPVQE